MNDKKGPPVSIIIPCKDVDRYVEECIFHCRRLDYEDYDLILLPDSPPDKLNDVDNLKVIHTGPVTPGAKRNIGTANSQGELCAFIDSDAYPRWDWLKNAVKYFKDPDVAAVGGPGLTPEEDSLTQKASGYILSSMMVGGLSSRYKIKQTIESDDVHSCNFIARRSVLERVGGWNEHYWPGEDTLICLAIKKLGMKILETPDVVIYHHRRPLFKAHLKQVFNFGLHRGFFAKKFKGNSLKPTYFTPSTMLIAFLACLTLAFITPVLKLILLAAALLYIGLSFTSPLLETKEKRLIPLVWLGTILTHIVYGFAFIAGLVKKELRR